MRTGTLFFAAGICLLIIAAPSPAVHPESSPPKNKGPVKPVKWVRVDQADWAVYMDAPAYHFSAAKQYLLIGDTVQAATELARGEAFLNFQKKRLSSAQEEIELLKKKVSTGNKTDTSAFNIAVSHALDVIDRKYTMVPMEIDGKVMSMGAPAYHMEKAKQTFKSDDRTVTADEIRRAAVFLRLKAAAMGVTPWSAVDSATIALQQLAMKVELGKVKNVKDLEEVFKSATSIFPEEKK